MAEIIGTVILVILSVLLGSSLGILFYCIGPTVLDWIDDAKEEWEHRRKRKRGGDDG